MLTWVKKGVVDPVKVYAQRSKTPRSIASLILTTEFWLRKSEKRIRLRLAAMAWTAVWAAWADISTLNADSVLESVFNVKQQPAIRYKVVALYCKPGELNSVLGQSSPPLQNGVKLMNYRA